jgi:hypothetical protein
MFFPILGTIAEFERALDGLEPPAPAVAPAARNPSSAPGR